MSRRRLTPEQAGEIARLREEKGWSYCRLATRFGVSPGAIQYQCLRQGAVSPRSRAGRSRGAMIVTRRDGRTMRRFTETEDRRLLELEHQGLPLKRIAATMDRPYTSIRLRLLGLALRDSGLDFVPHDAALEASAA